MTPRRAEDAARSLLRSLNIDEEPVDPAKIVEAIGASLVFAAMEPSISGMLIREPGRTTIGVNRGHALVRRRFTIAHELGHLRLHRGRSLILDAAVRVNLRDPESAAATNREEIEANAFAAALLMPEELIIRAAASSKITAPEDLSSWLAARFKVSVQAMNFRLVNLGLTV
jgi:Zn-dependent peptidase ImmA (M78 family)